jgi:glucose/arabinose dehydrogenase
VLRLQRVHAGTTTAAAVRLLRFVCALALVAALAGCYVMRPSSGGGQTDFKPPRQTNPSDIALPAGYRIEVVASGLTFPTAVAFDGQGTPHVIEAGYSYGEAFTTPRLLRVERSGGVTEVARGENNGPWTGIAFANGAFYVAEGGQMKGGRILRITSEGRISALVENLPSLGDHHTNGPAIGRDGQIYFTVGVATNSGVVGEDNFKFGWLKRFPKFHDVPCHDIELSGQNFDSPNVLGGGGTAQTGAFVPFGTTTSKGQVIRGQVPCSGSVLRISPAGGRPELIAWGFRNPFGIAFAPDGQLYVTENGFDDRGSRPVWGAGDVLWRITPGTWYGWPDYAEGRTVTNEDFRPPMKKSLAPLLAREPGKPPAPVAIFGVHASADGFDFSHSNGFGHVGQAFVAEFGDEAPTTGKVLHPVGFRVVRVDVTSGHIEEFAANKGKHVGPASKFGGAGFERPVSARFDPSGNALYVVDFGVLLHDSGGAKPQQGTGVLWRITRQ